MIAKGDRIIDISLRATKTTDARATPALLLRSIGAHLMAEWLGQYHFTSIEEAQDHATRWLWTYNNERPNMGIGGMTPVQKLKAV